MEYIVFFCIFVFILIFWRLSYLFQERITKQHIFLLIVDNGGMEKLSSNFQWQANLVLFLYFILDIMLSFIYNCLLIFLLCYSHSLLDGRINNVLSLCHDPAILSSVHSIIRNMVACEDANQQQLHYLQSCGFGGLWRFAGPFTKVGFFLLIFIVLFSWLSQCS